MTKKLILLILALPLFLMICLFTATSGVSLAVPISVSRIELISESTVFLDLDNPKDVHHVEYAVYPTNAANKDVTISYLPLDGEDGEEETFAKFEYDEETGYLKPLAPGAAQVVITTVDGGYSVRFTAIVTSRELISIESSVPNKEASYDEELGMKKYTLEPGEEFKLQNKFNPSTASSILVNYESSDPAVATVSARGAVKARSVGTTIITVKSRANEHISYSFALEVKNPQDKAMVIVDKEVSTVYHEGKIDISILAEEYNLTYQVVDKDGNIDPDAYHYIQFVWDEESKSLRFGFVDEEYYGTIYVDVILETADGITTERCVIKKYFLSEDEKLSVYLEDFENGYYDVLYLQKSEIFFTIPNMDHINFSFEVEQDNNNIAISSENGKLVTYVGESTYSMIIDPVLVGTTEITITVTNNENGEVSQPITIPVVIKPSRILAENPGYNGYESSYTIGKYNASDLADNGETGESSLEYYLGYTINDKIGTGFYDCVQWVTNSDAVKVDENGKIVFVEGYEDFADFVELKAVLYYNGHKVMESQPIEIRCVANGYNVYNYMELVKVTEAGKVVVLQKDIVNDFGKDANGNMLPANQLYKLINSTYDTTWYHNSERLEEAKVKVLISFKEDVYGNGHVINAHNVVSHGQGAIDANTGKPTLENHALFRGPLYFVAITQSGGGISVAGQDNICFAAYEGVSINNVELVGRNMLADEDTGSYNLQHLHYAGTVLEVLGDDVTVEYSRVRNGRNVIRAFGDAEDPNKEITLNITNSTLSNGRDFIMRVGSNRTVTGTKTDWSPSLHDPDESDNINFATRLQYYRLTDAEKLKYDQQFINTYVNINDSILEQPGIFAIGVDSHFSGKALADGREYGAIFGDKEALSAWYNLAKTSYGVKLSLTGDVRLYCWKELDSIDSSSLIEDTSIKMDAGEGDGNAITDLVNFIIPDLVRDVIYRANGKKFTNAVYNAKVNEEVAKGNGSWFDIWSKGYGDDKVTAEDEIRDHDMVHAGIVFFGGGKNYSVLETSGYTNYAFNSYEISLIDAGKAALQTAAGQESFYFYIYDSTTLGFLPEDQEIMKNDNSYLYRK